MERAYLKYLLFGFPLISGVDYRKESRLDLNIDARDTTKSLLSIGSSHILFRMPPTLVSLL